MPSHFSFASSRQHLKRWNSWPQGKTHFRMWSRTLREAGTFGDTPCGVRDACSRVIWALHTARLISSSPQYRKVIMRRGGESCWGSRVKERWPWCPGLSEPHWLLLAWVQPWLWWRGGRFILCVILAFKAKDAKPVLLVTTLYHNPVLLSPFPLVLPLWFKGKKKQDFKTWVHFHQSLKILLR